MLLSDFCNAAEFLPVTASEFVLALSVKVEIVTAVSQTFSFNKAAQFGFCCNFPDHLIVFFRFLTDENPIYKEYKPNDFKVSDLDSLQAVDIEEYMEYLKVYSDDNDNLVTNGERGLKRKMSALRSLGRVLIV